MVASARSVGFTAVPASVIVTQVPCTLPSCANPSTICPIFSVPIFKERFRGELMWQFYYEKNFSRLPHKWHLLPVDEKPPGTWSSFVDSAKVRFGCEACGHGWTSMKGRVTFWCSFMQNSGVVAFRLYGQQCTMCHGDAFETPLWYTEEILKVLSNIFERVVSVFYQCNSSSPKVYFRRRRGKTKSQHISEKCQACLDGICSRRK